MLLLLLLPGGGRRGGGAEWCDLELHTHRAMKLPTVTEEDGRRWGSAGGGPAQGWRPLEALDLGLGRLVSNAVNISAGQA